jgi:hypothetical protein
MATTTPNYGWDVPTSTDYVKDGATAIETLGDDIDASMFTALAGKKALQHITTSTISGTSVLIDNCFTSAYTNYKFVMTVTGGNTGYITMQFRNATPATLTGADYYLQELASFSSTTNSSQNIGVTAFNISYRGNTSSVSLEYDVYAPFITRDTLIAGQSFGYDGANYVNRIIGGQYAPTTSIRGMLISFPAGTTTGIISVYGYTE